RDRRLVGVLALSELVRARSTNAVRTLMHEPVESLPAWTPAAAVRTHPGWQRFHSLPVVDDAGCLVGAIRYRTLRHLERMAETGAVRPEGPTIAALGELFHIGMAGFVEGISAVAVPRAKAGGLESREERDA
ncbi:MAG TPA: hypothetical protein VLD67_05405, partial [Vicinamibacterales bacterium]|nr:hypothetical protein [Vicinamibacterales bacterium]